MPTPKPPMNKREIREFAFQWAKDVDQDADPDYFVFEGYASTFNNTDWYGDTIVPGAFKQSLVEKTPSLCWQHDLSMPVGVIDDAHEDLKGLYIKGRLPKDMDMVKGTLMPLIKCRAIKSFSIGFNTVDSSQKDDGGRLLKQIDLWETSFVTVPADPHADLMSVKSIDLLKASIKTKRDLEHLLRESGLFSKDAAVWLASHFNLTEGEPLVEDEVQTEVHKHFKTFNEDMQQLVRSLQNG